MVDPGDGSLTYSVDQPPFVGRRAEVDHLLALHTGAKAGATRVAVVAGPAGVGKTALVEKFLEEAGEACVLRISGEESETALAFGVFDRCAQRFAGVSVTTRGRVPGTGLSSRW